MKHMTSACGQTHHSRSRSWCALMPGIRAQIMNRIVTILPGVIASPAALILVPIAFNIQNPDADWLNLVVDYFTYIYPIALGGVVLLGLPAYLLLHHFGYANYITLASAGTLGGAAFGSLATPIFLSMLFYAVCGLVVASIFWMLVVHLPGTDHK